MTRLQDFMRRIPHQLLSASLLVLMAPALLSAEEIKVTTYTYKKVGNLEIKLDVHREDDDRVRPAVVWIHGGALIMGHRAGISGRVKKAALERGCALVSIDYRLAPETQLPEIIADVEDAFRWIHEQGPTQANLDTSQLIVSGGSAGGYLTLLVGHRVKPRPAALVAFWGYGSLVAPWYAEPSPHRRHQGAKKLSRAQVQEEVSGPPISDSRKRKGNGGLFYQYCRQHGIWPKEVSGWDPKTEADKFAPYMPVRNVTKDYPPTFLFHGTEDTDVPFEESVGMAREFKKHGVPHVLFDVHGGEHGLGGGDPKRINEGYEQALEFVLKHVDE
uniref:Secreted family S9 peptidase n=1 Tax=uncultured planctomycete 3FN TaxID=455066 RepID=A9LGW2_9BACT|nr:secreted family S9 peptidase [uncultured planctomycete 3FN]